MSAVVRRLASRLWRLVTRRADRVARHAGPATARLRPVIGKHVAMAGRPVSTGIPVPRHLGCLMVAIAVTAVVLATQNAGASQQGFSTGATVASVYPMPSAHQAPSSQEGPGGRGASENAAPQRGSATAKQSAAGAKAPAAPAPDHPAAPAAPAPPDNQLLPAAVSGGQQSMPVSSDRMNNAKVIVDQARAMHLGNRAAVIAVATAMQESKLENVNYGDEDSLGLFQQRPSAGWGSPDQITNPSYAAGAFLTALYQYERGNSRWATQPLWMAAQGVQDSAFPTAYAQWEQQAANIVWRLDR